MMLRNPRQSPEDMPGARFREILAEVRRAKKNFDQPDEEGEGSTFAANPLANAIFSIDDRPATAGGGSPWDAALDWIDAPAEGAEAVEPPPPANLSAEAILDELGLTENLTFDELNQVRRLYMWRNHPDRHGEAHRENATRRVAIANMLVDRAQARLISGRRA